MNRILKSLLLCSITAAAILLASCGEVKTPAPDTAPKFESSPAPIPEPSPAPAFEPSPAPVPEPSAENDLPTVAVSAKGPAPAEKLRYDVKGVELSHTYLLGSDSTTQVSIYLSNAEINELLDVLSALEFTDENKGTDLTGGFVYRLVIGTDGEEYGITINYNTVTLWESVDVMQTLEGRKTMKTYKFEGLSISHRLAEMMNSRIEKLEKIPPM